MIVERKDYNRVITVKLVIPGYCNARCVFCYNNGREKCDVVAEKELFLNRFIDSIDDLLKRIDGKNPVSIDITGGEPTLDWEFLIKVLGKLREYDIKSKVLRTTLTTNGVNLIKVADHMKGVVDYVNISVHDWRPFVRRDILGFDISVESYKRSVERLRLNGITCSAAAVIFRSIHEFNRWRDSFILFAKEVGFVGLRFRCDVRWENGDIFDHYMESALNSPEFQVITHENTNDSHWCRLRMEDGFRVFYLHGVLDTSDKTKGIEYVIDSNGLCYCDYRRGTSIDDYQFEIGKVFDVF